MSFAQEIKSILQHGFLSQEAFGRELNVSFSSVNRWEGGRAKPNVISIKSIKKFFEAQDIDFSNLEKAWFEYGKEEDNDSQ